jgi:xylose isomerase
LEELFERVSSIEGVQAVELIASCLNSPEDVARVKENLHRTGLELSAIIPDHFGKQIWGKGAFTAEDPSVRAAAVSHTRKMMDILVELGGDVVSLWPGQDGYDYHFQADYLQKHNWFVEGIRQCCDYRPEVRVALEYKPKEPRNRCFLSNVSSTLLMIQEIQRPNCGVTIDFGHALVAYENVAESVALLSLHGNTLFHLHMNDNYGYWDDDMITGSVHTISYLEFLYWLKKTNYQGWLSMDQYPYREDGKRAVNESLRWLDGLTNVMNRMDADEVERVIHSGDATESSALLRKYLFAK